MIQDFLSHGISIPIGSSNKFTKKLVKMLHQNAIMVTLLLGHIGMLNATCLGVLLVPALHAASDFFKLEAGLQLLESPSKPKVTTIIWRTRIRKREYSFL